MERKSPYLAITSCVLLLLAVVTPFVAPFLWPAPGPAPDSGGGIQNAQAWHWLGVMIVAIFVMIGFGVLATLFAIASLIRREKYPVLPLLVILVGGGGSAYLIVTMFVH